MSRAPSTSAVPEEILQAARREGVLAMIDRSVIDYYDSLSGEEAEELAKCGEFALRQFPKESA
jgi:hypothetical protein